MPLPSGTAALKIHPAIGFARLSTNSDNYTFGEPHPQPSYKSDGLIKRQAVQYRIFAYNGNNQGIQELTPAWLAANGLHAVWHARVANRKTAKGWNDDSYTIAAVAQSDQNGGRLVGRCGDFAEGQSIELGEITGSGRFIPPQAAIYRKTAGMPIPPSGMRDKNFCDNTCDGIISVQLVDVSTGMPLSVPIYDAWTIVAPPDFAPEWDDVGGGNLENYLTELLSLPNQPAAFPVNRQAREIDRIVLQRGTSNFGPGIEIAPAPPEEIFYTGTVLGDPDEVRVRPGASIGSPGTLPGELTIGLCSPWQFDFRACTCGWWPNHRPDVAFREDATGPEVDWLRRRATDVGEIPMGGDELTTNADFVNHVDKLGIVRREGHDRVEKERDEDISDQIA
ncbi:LodA/GoxA family CTQ-dependent oxidase [Mesorhizobium sp. BR1-1-14]|uniref:LodA/GoxA family CTQ-dependent oxidase n=1 Tax=Mesorhizobium sp. BR1-1-14 TaxID=2876655 RepID=UPI001CD0C96D|nr:LodA/GoxA family CTQ-dependent oxidase [Mesorhizobium sp. BR1-1-14]MBZ9959318.1 LodA/GoxA family CTQ-dependent oxidase [Mesorhizobium sp. BR1-1-14]